MNQLNVHFLPSLVSPDELAGGTAVVIDVLRATTTIVYALAAGARAVVPCLTIEEARAKAAGFPRGEVVLAGERGGLPIPGFDLGNSPAEFTRHSVGGKTVVLTTTNGTKALLHCRQAREILIGAFVNLSAVSSAVSDAANARVDIVCAGTDGNVTMEDVLAAGAVVRRAMLRGTWHTNDEELIAHDVWQRFAERTWMLADALTASRGGRNLLSIGMHKDIEDAAEIDRFSIVPRFDPATGEVSPRSATVG